MRCEKGADVAKMELDEFGEFVVTPEGIAFMFSPYVVSGYASGSFQVTLKWSEIAGITDRKRWPFIERWTGNPL